MERTVTVRTPESIAFSYELAGLGSRFLALAIDMLIQIAVLVVLAIVWTAAAERFAQMLESLRVRSHAPEAVFISVALIVVFLILYGYFIAFEMWWNGQTPGKRAMGIRVVRDAGYPVDFSASVIRNLVRVVESILGFYVSSLVSMLLSRENKRIGDLAAATIVVRDSAFQVTDPSRWAAGDEIRTDPSSIAGASELNRDELAVVQRYVERRTLLPHGVAQLTAARIASAIRPKLGSDACALSDDELLVRIASLRR